MNEKLVKELISCKLRMSGLIIGLLPGNAGQKIKSAHQCIIKAVNNATSQYAGNQAPENIPSGNALKGVTIE
ncbi:MAG: hypothetical protein N3I35_06100 [Clostridia bacterium]|nr:hypothetical protein [Clostridia bacterium]